MLFLAYVAVPSVEAEAVVTYANNYLPYFLQPHTSGLLTIAGFFACAVLLLIFAWLNLLAVRTLLTVNSTVTWWKIAVPVLTLIVLILASSHWNVWAADPHSYKFSGIFTALPTAGIVFSYLGFPPPSTSAAKARILVATFPLRSSARWLFRVSSTSCFSSRS